MLNTRSRPRHVPPAAAVARGVAVAVTVTVGIAVGGAGVLDEAAVPASRAGVSSPEAPVQAQASSPVAPRTEASATARRRQY
ncbi:hypothetical protein [Actinomadura chibensis]|uniref:Uncharacterized protein n=1 Tax=Actinomadura chibensis TaxID=392828 RepID=A0A5D0NWG2_9ACTN|nr:hypothetical protein [Actinomadura chibensis]TYB48787.1 hypothetical protein FXF69_06360 [Actinomadura chibensis]